MPKPKSPEHNPKNFENARLLATDFDGTVAQTFEKSPSGVGVDEAYDQAIDEVFGPNAVDRYHADGGLKNRSVVEVVRGLSPESIGFDINLLVDKLTDSKLAILMGEIGTRFDDGTIWPRPTNGYLVLLEELQKAKSEGRQIDSLILSSGHEAFIRLVYEKWSVAQPDYVLAQERLAYLGLSNESKPSRKVMDAALETWAEDYETNAYSSDLKKRVVYVGDDNVKDGDMARDSGIEFFHLNPTNSEDIWPKVSARLGLSDAALRGIKHDDK
jgi:hypothetical protein